MAIFDLDDLKNRKKVGLLLEKTKGVILNESFSGKSLQPLMEGFIGLLNSDEIMYGRGVFISHRSTYKYKKEARRIAILLDDNKYDVYLDAEDYFLKSITGGSTNADNDLIMELLKYGIDEAKFFLCLLSYNIDSYPQSSIHWVKEELNYAKIKNKEMFRYHIDTNNIPDFCIGIENISDIDNWIKFEISN